MLHSDNCLAWHYLLSTLSLETRQYEKYSNQQSLDIYFCSMMFCIGLDIKVVTISNDGTLPDVVSWPFFSLGSSAHVQSFRCFR